MGLQSWVATKAILLLIGGKMNAIREWLKGKKTYLSIAAAIVASLIAWADGSISNTQLIQSILLVLPFAPLRAGVKTAMAESSGTANGK